MARSKTPRRSTPTVDVPLAVTEKDLRTLARVARIQQVLARNPDKPGREEYEADVEAARTRWNAMSPTLRKAVIAQVSTFPDLTAGDVKSAVAALED